MGDRCDGWDNGACQGTPYCPPRCPRFVADDGTALLVRPYRPADRDPLVAMYERFDAESRTMGLPPATEPRLHGWLDALTVDGWSLVATDGDAVVGHIGVTPADSADPELVVFVDAAYRGRGVGSELLRQLVAYADDWGHESVALSVAADNRRAASVYDNLGFDVIERASKRLEMALSLDRRLTERVRRPPAERDRSRE